MPEDRRRFGVVSEMSVAANASLGVLRELSRLGLVDRAAEERLAESFVSRLGIKAASVRARVATLSGGNQQKVALARGLATRPKVLILDEPTQGIDVGAKAEVHRLVEELAAEGLAVLVISSDLEEVLAVSDRLLVMRAGRIAGELARREATPEKVLALALGHGPATGARGRGSGGAVSSRAAALVMALGAALLLLAVRAPRFFSAANLADLATGLAPALVAAMGMTLVILARQIDISIGSQFAICGVVLGLLAKAGLPVPLAAAAAVAAGAGLGAVNGGLVAGLGLPSIVVTLATMVAWREGLRWATEGAWVRGLPASFQWLGLGQTGGRILIVATAALVFAAVAWGLVSLRAGRAVYATGSDAEAARLLGLRPRRVVFGVFVVMGALSGLAAVLTTLQFIDVQANAGVGLELRIIAAVVVGGVAISGGRGSSLGVLLGVLFLARPRPGARLPRRQGALGPCPAGRDRAAGRRGRGRAPRAERIVAERRALGPTAALLGLLALELVAFGVFGHNFLTLTNGFEIVRASVEVGLLALALTAVIATGGIDLSVGSLLGLCAVVFGWLAREAGLAVPLAAALAVATGTLGGLLNGWLVTALRLPPLIVTLGTYSLYRGLAEGRDRRRRQLHGLPRRLPGPRPGDVPRRRACAAARARGRGPLLLAAASSAPSSDAASRRSATRPRPRATRACRSAPDCALVYVLSGACRRRRGARLRRPPRPGEGRRRHGLRAARDHGRGAGRHLDLRRPGERRRHAGSVCFVLALLQNGLRLADQPAELAGILTGMLLLLALALSRERKAS